MAGAWVARLRRWNIEAYMSRGLRLLVCRAASVFDDGTEPCPDCHEPAYTASNDPSCSRCFGTGFIWKDVGIGYSEPEMTWGNLIFSAVDESIVQGMGAYQSVSARGMMCHFPIVSEHDVVFFLEEHDESTGAYSPGPAYMIVGGVDYYTLRGKFSGVTRNTLPFRDLLLYQEFQAAMLPPTDPRSSLHSISAQS